LFGGAIDGKVLMSDCISQKHVTIGQHEKAAKQVFWVNELGVVLSFSYDGYMKVWDLK